MTPDTLVHIILGIGILVSAVNCGLLGNRVSKLERLIKPLHKDFQELSLNWSIVAKELREQNNK